ncbi:hypothetical protein ACSIGC_13600 [Tenacibaculum sp. ZS6-P6]|uniref:hypothetical protein n=1 Tax=Tenacibaculum sp. ZS6-P6 TaxID=3447503 RepID=UPI003F9605D1
MKIKKLLLLFISSVYTLLAQDKVLDSAYVKYFGYEREIPYLHLNKTTFVQGEEIWFKAYVLNTNTQKLHQSTSNLYCSIYDDKGVFKKTKLIYLNDGVGNGSFKVDSTFAGKNFYIKASTNYMQNFQENQSFIQKIKIINKEQTKESTITNQTKYDLQVLPEGGHLLANSTNSVGIILKDQHGNIPEVEKGQIIDSKNEVIKDFTLNRFGMVKIPVYINLEEDYKAEIKLRNGEKITTKFPVKNNRGVSLAFENISSNMTKVIVSTNKETIDELVDRKYYVLIHNTNSFLRRDIEFKENLLTYSLFISKKLFKPGTNIVTLFTDDDQPIAERLFFNYQKSLFDNVIINLNEGKDSVSLNVKSTNNLGEYKLSASVLPYDTKAYKPYQNIYSKFLLAPYIKGSIKNGDYFFTDINRKKLWELDLLLLTQGWSKYSWYNIFNNPPTERFDFERGIKVKGTFNMTGLGNDVDVFIRSGQNKLFTSRKLKGNKFEFNNLFIKDNSKVYISYSDKKGKFKMPNLYVQPSQIINKGKIKIPEQQDQIEKRDEGQDLAALLTETEEVLNEIEIKGKLKFNHTPLIGDRARGYKVSEDYSKHQALFSFLRSVGLDILTNPETVRIRRSRQRAFSLRNNPADEGIVARSGASDFGVNMTKERAFDSTADQREILESKTRVFLDNQDITLDPKRLLNLRHTKLGEYDEIFITDVFDLRIYLYTKDRVKTENYVNAFYEYKVPIGFHVQKEYYQPKYLNTNSDSFKRFGAVHWEPNIYLDENKKEHSITFPKLKQESVRVFIEGISKDGKLISMEKVFKINYKNN